MFRKIKNLLHFLESFVSAVYYRFPGKKLVVIGVTGTDGKTTVSFLIHHILTVAGYKTAILSTLSSAHATTPGRGEVQKFLARAVKNGCTHAVMEVTSIGLDQYRVWGIDFTIGVITNIAPNEHLDYHKNFEDYKKIKLKFLNSCKRKVYTPDLKKSDFRQILASNHLPGDYNVQNVMSASAAVRLLNIPDDIIKKAVASFHLPSGRFEIVVKKPFIVIVDFAHTPQAFTNVLPEAKKMTGKTGRLVHVFGCTGDRDKEKRPIMGEIASKYDDIIILTHEDTYSENKSQIIDAIEKGIEDKNKINRIEDRREAIKHALKIAKPGDVVILTGVGHQKSMNINGREVPWSEQKTVLELIYDKKK